MDPVRGACRIEVARLDEVALLAEAAGQAWLNAGEVRRLDAMGSAIRRRQFLAGHWMVRRLASSVHGGGVADWSLETLADGRLCLRASGIEAAVSLSHSGQWLAAAVADAPIGIDLEFPRKSRDLMALAGFVFSPEECRHLADLPEDRRSDAFHVLWTLKEARGKRGGEGLQPAQARRSTSQACPVAEAEAWHWTLPDLGNLALATWPGARLECSGIGPDTAPSPWRYASAS